MSHLKVDCLCLVTVTFSWKVTEKILRMENFISRLSFLTYWHINPFIPRSNLSFSSMSTVQFLQGEFREFNIGSTNYPTN